MSARRSTRNTKRRETIGPSVGSVSRAGLDSRVTVLAVEQALAELGLHARLSDIVAKAKTFEKEIIQSRSGRKRGHVC